MRRAVTMAVAALGLLCGVAVAPAAADAPGSDDGRAGQAAYLAAQLRTDPVYVSDQVPRSVPRSAKPRFAEIAERTGVPTYLLVLPAHYTDGEGLLASVHDHLGEDGLYVLLGANGIYGDVATYGVEVPAESAEAAALFESPSDAGALKKFQLFVEILTSGEAAQREDAAREKFRGSVQPPDAFVSSTERDNQGTLTGFLLSGVPLSIVLCGWYVLRRGERRRREGAPGEGGPVRRKRPRQAVAAVAAVSAGAVAWGCLAAFDETRSDAGPPPTAQDVRARVERVAEGLSGDPFYTDPESPDVLTSAQYRRLDERVREFEHPVYLAAVPLLTEDASGGDADVLLHRLHEQVGEDGLYVVADPSRGDIAIRNYGVRLDESAQWEIPDGVEYPVGEARDAEDHRLYDRVGRLLDHLAGSPDGPPGDPDPPYSFPPDPVQEDLLAPVMSGAAFWGGLALLGPLAAGVMFGLTALPFTIAGRRRHRGAPRLEDGSARPVPEAPSRPSAGWLRRTVRSELDTLSTDFDVLAAERSQAVRDRVWDCMDAARLLIDEDGDRRVDANATPVELACALTLARVGRHALADGSVRDTRTWCAVNPLHGAATHVARYPLPGFAGRDEVPVCGSCRQPAGSAEQSMLRLRDPVDGATVRYDELDGPVQLFGSDTDRLVTDIREYLGVH